MKWRSLEESSLDSDLRPLRDIYAERKAMIAKYVAPDTQDVHVRAVAELQANRLAANILPVGGKTRIFSFPITTASPFLPLTFLRKDAWF